IIESFINIHNEAKKGLRDKSLISFWEELKPNIKKYDIIYSTKCNWKKSLEIFLLEKTEEESVIHILENLNIAIVHQELRPYFSLLRKEEVGVQLLDLLQIAESLERLGLTKRVEKAGLPDWLRSEDALHAIWRELGILQERRQTKDKKRGAEKRFLKIAIALGRDGALWPCEQIYQADSKTVELFGAIDSTIPFLSELGEEGKFLKSICPQFSIEVAVDRLSRMSQDSLNLAWKEGKLIPANLLGWFESHRQDILVSEELKKKLASLPIFPTTSTLRPLIELGLPGDFEDPIGLTDIIDLQQLGGRREFLKELGAHELTFLSYAREHIPRAFRDPETSVAKKQKTLRLLAEHLGNIVDDPLTRKNLTEIEIIECEDGVFRQPGEVYFKSGMITEILGENVNFAVLPNEQEIAIRELYKWLGVAESPRNSDIVERVKELTQNPPNDESRKAIERIFKHLSERRDLEKAEELNQLREIHWLPAINISNQWFRPSDLFMRTIQHLFETQGKFLDIPPAYQRETILNFLGIKTKPEVKLVVSHLLECAKQNREVNKEVYRFLNDYYKDPHVDNLKNNKCLLLSDGSYAKPDQVFWGNHPFGRYRHRLNPDLRTYNNLFSLLGVREGPDHRDAVAVIEEISSEYGTMNNQLSEEDHVVLFNCWQMLEKALDTGSIEPDYLVRLKEKKVIPNKDRLLNFPKYMFFEDRPGLASKFGGFLEKNVISRSQGAWKAMAAVGVRSLGNAVKSHLQDCNDPLKDEIVANRIRERRLQLERAIDAMLAGTDLKVNWDVLERLSCFSVSHLSIYYSTSLFNRERHSAPEEVPAHFQRKDSCLYYVRENGGLPWPSISRELALALCPEAEPGRLASGIKEVLSARSEAEAGAILDELGFPPLERGPENSSNTPAETVDLGGVEGGEEIAFTTEEAGIEISREGATTPDLESSGLGKPTTAESESEKSAPSPERGTTRQKKGTVTSIHKTWSPKSVLRTYVAPRGKESEGKSEDPERKAKRKKVDQAGIDKVLDYEHKAGRFPKDMGPTHKGYDIESSNGKGEIERYIEVKSLSGDWDLMGVHLTKSQFEKAMELGDKYWLYVVERAESEDFCIRRINDPARRANEFRYDDGWRALEEDENYGHE
ncbi:MAG: DUF3883 domain-containing protein, partial [Candidatus Bathyarchaeia archaeon]